MYTKLIKGFLKQYINMMAGEQAESSAFFTSSAVEEMVNTFIHTINTDIVAVLPVQAGVILITLSVILTLIGGFIPSKQADKKDPVLALRSE